MPSQIPVQAPMATPPRYGLLPSLGSTDAGRWMTADSVISYAPEGCQEGETIDPCGTHTFDPPSPPATVSWHAYILTVSERCSTFGLDEDERRARITRLLNADTERQLGAELWDGTLAQASTMPDTSDWPNTWLTDTASPSYTLLDTEAVPPVDALACLEQHLASNNHGQQGAIHASVQLVTFWNSFDLLRRENGKLLTDLDNLVIASPGYPSSNDGTTVMAYATDLPRIFLGPVTPSPVMDSIDRRTNTIVMVATRPGLVEWQRCRHGAIEVDIEPCGFEGGS